MNINNLSFQNDKIKDINSFFSSSNDSQLFLTVHLEKGETEKLNINKNTNPEKLAYDFCLKHNLDFSSVKELVTKIKKFQENNLISDKENLGISSNIKSNKSVLPLGNYIININNNNKKSLINYSSNTINLKELENHKKNKDNNFKNIIFSNSNITPINSGSNFSKNNLAYTSSDKNLNIFDFGTSKEEIDDKLTNNNNNSNVNFFNESNKNKFEYNKKKSNDNYSSNSNYFNESFNNKINNLEKAYVNFNPNNKKSDSKKNNSKNEIKVNAKEIISQTIKNCLKSLEKEENIDNNITISENNNNSLLKQENKTISVENDNPENNQNKIDFIVQNDDKFSLKDIYLIPKEKKISLFNKENSDKDNKKDYDIRNPEKNIIEPKNPFDCVKDVKIKEEEDNNIYFNENLFKNKEENITNEKETKINNLEENINNLMKIPKNSPNNFKNSFNKNSLKKYLNKNNLNLNLNNNYNSYYNTTQFIKDNDIITKTPDNNIIQNEIKFSLLSNKNKLPLTYSHKGFKVKKYTKLIKRNFIKFRSYHESNKKDESLKYSNSIKNHSNNSLGGNNMNKINLIRENSIKNNRNTSSLKMPINNDIEKRIFNSLKEDKSFNKSYPLSYTRSEKSNNKDSLKNKNSKNKDYNIRTTTTSMGNRTNYNSSISRVSRDSTNRKFYKNKKLIKLNNMNKIPVNHVFNYSNEFLLKKQKEKEINTYYNNRTTIINNSQNNLFYTNLSYNNNKKIRVSPDYLSQRTKSNIAADYKNFLKKKLLRKNKNYHPNLNNLTQNLIVKKEIINSLKNIFNLITKNNRTLDAFAIVNKKIIPNEIIYNIIKKIVNHCDKSKRFIEYDEFINKATDLFELFSTDEKITILNFN